jgi:RNAse (barnase) inhibitor barstar
VLGVLGALLVVGVVVVLLVVNLARGVVEDLEEQGFTLDPQQGETYGDNPELDALWDACAGGDMGACDDLYFTSESGSAYEEFGDTCGGLTDGGSLCAQQDDAGASGSAETYGDDPELDALWDACAAGDLAACDELYFSSGIGTEYEEFGETCGRTQEGFGLCAP